MKPSKTLLWIFVNGLFLILAGGCESAGQYQLSLGGQTLWVELALTPQERALGLMHRSSMPLDQGMLFLFEEEKPLSFWMKNTEIPLSIAYINRRGVIRKIQHMTPFSLQGVPSEYSVQFALEVNQGLFEKWGVKEGDFVDLSGLFEKAKSQFKDKSEYRLTLDRLPNLEKVQKTGPLSPGLDSRSE